MSLQKTLTWGCVCLELRRNVSRNAHCAFHALEEQLTSLEVSFGCRGGVPLFPTIHGTTVSKESVVATFEAAAAKCGIPLMDAYGHRLFGGHSLRVSGAQWMATRGLLFISIQLMARWSSDVISRYVGEAPLSRVTEEYRKANASVDLEGVLADAKLTAAALRSKIQGIDEHTASLIQEERRLRALIDALPPPGAARGASFVTAPRGKWHVPACRHYPDLPICDWRTRCGWAFGLARHSFADVLEQGAELCKICAPNAAARDEASDEV